MSTAYASIPIFISDQTGKSKVWDKLKAAAEKVFSIRYPDERRSISKKALEAVDKFIEQYKGNRQNGEVKEIFILTKHEAAIEKYLDLEFGEENEKKSRIRRQLLTRENAFKGTYSKRSNCIVIDLQSVTESHPASEIDQEKCLTATVIHEALHARSNFEMVQRINNPQTGETEEVNIEWLVEGLTQIIEREVVASVDGRDWAEQHSCQPYHEYEKLIEQFAGLVGDEGNILITSYLNGSFFAIRTCLIERGATEQEIYDLFKAGNDTSEPDKRLQAIRNLSKKMSRIERDIKNRKEGKKKKKEIEEEMYREGEDEKPGTAPVVIRKVQKYSGDKDPANAARLVLGAAMYFKIHEGRDARAVEVFGRVADEYMKANNVFPVALNGTYDHTPQINKSETHEQNNVVLVNVEYGVDYEDPQLIEAAVVSYSMSNSGQLPDAAQVRQIIDEAAARVTADECIKPETPAVTTEILANALDHVQNKELPESEMWIRDAGLEFAEAHDLGIPHAVMTGKYDENARAEIVIVLEAMDEFRLSGALVADRCEKFFTSLGIEPTAADILGLATHIAANEKDIENLTLLGYNPRTDGTFITIGRTEREIAAEVISNTAVETSREDLVYQYWQSREAGTAVPLFTELTTPIESVGVPIDRTKNDLRVTPSIILANRIETEQPADRVIAAKGSMIVAISGDGTSTTPRDFRYNESSAIVGATGGSVDVRNKKTGEFVMAQEVVKVTGSTHHREKSDTVEEIMALSERTKNMAKKIAEVYDTDEEKLRAIFELVRDGGELGIEASMYLQDRPKGSKTVAEVIRTKQANCLESTLAYLAVAKEVFVDRGDIAVIPLNIVSINKRISVGHASVGVLTTANGFVGDNRFDTDAKFRRAVLEATGFEDSADLKFVIIDPVNRLFDYRFATTVPLNKAQIVSYFKTNSANYALRRKDEELAEKEFKKALEFWPTNPIVLRHTAYAMASDGKYGHALDEIRKIAEDQRDSAYYRAEMEIWTRQLFEVKERDPNKFQRLCVLAEQAVDKAINCDKANDQAWRLKEMLTRAGGQGKNAKKVRSKRIRSIKQERKAVGLNLRTSSHARGVGIDTRENNKERIELGLRIKDLYHGLIVYELEEGKPINALAAAIEASNILPLSNDIRRTKALVAAVCAVNSDRAKGEKFWRDFDEFCLEAKGSETDPIIIRIMRVRTDINPDPEIIEAIYAEIGISRKTKATNDGEITETSKGSGDNTKPRNSRSRDSSVIHKKLEQVQIEKRKKQQRIDEINSDRRLAEAEKSNLTRLVEVPEDFEYLVAISNLQIGETNYAQYLAPANMRPSAEATRLREKFDKNYMDNEILEIIDKFVGDDKGQLPDRKHGSEKRKRKGITGEIGEEELQRFYVDAKYYLISMGCENPQDNDIHQVARAIYSKNRQASIWAGIVGGFESVDFKL